MSKWVHLLIKRNISLSISLMPQLRYMQYTQQLQVLLGSGTASQVVVWRLDVLSFNRR